MLTPYHVVFMGGKIKECPLGDCQTSGRTTRRYVAALRIAALRTIGREEQDWQLVADKTVIGFHVNGIGAFEGEIIELR